MKVPGKELMGIPSKYLRSIIDLKHKKFLWSCPFDYACILTLYTTDTPTIDEPEEIVMLAV
jgi:hypothetical protein